MNMDRAFHEADLKIRRLRRLVSNHLRDAADDIMHGFPDEETLVDMESMANVLVLPDEINNDPDTDWQRLQQETSDLRAETSRLQTIIDGLNSTSAAALVSWTGREQHYQQ